MCCEQLRHFDVSIKNGEVMSNFESEVVVRVSYSNLYISLHGQAYLLVYLIPESLILSPEDAPAFCHNSAQESDLTPPSRLTGVWMSITF